MSLAIQPKYKGLVPSQLKNCKVCMNDRQNEYLQKIYDKKISIEIAAMEMGVTSLQWRNHLRFCVRNAVESAIAPDIEGIAKRVVDYVDELVDQLDRTKVLSKRMNEAMLEQELDPRMISSWALVEKQLSHTIEMMAKMSGELNSSAVVNINNVKMEFNDFKSRVMDILCPLCKEKLLNSDDDDEIIDDVDRARVIKVVEPNENKYAENDDVDKIMSEVDNKIDDIKEAVGKYD